MHGVESEPRDLAQGDLVLQANCLGFSRAGAAGMCQCRRRFLFDMYSPYSIGDIFMPKNYVGGWKGDLV